MKEIDKVLIDFRERFRCGKVSAIDFPSGSRTMTLYVIPPSAVDGREMVIAVPEMGAYAYKGGTLGICQLIECGFGYADACKIIDLVGIIFDPNFRVINTKAERQENTHE